MKPSMRRNKDGSCGALNPDLTMRFLKRIRSACTDEPSGMKRGAEVLVLI